MTQPTETNAANLFQPNYMPEGTIYTLAVGGIFNWVKSNPYCLSFADQDGLAMALNALGYTYVETTSADPWPAGGQTFYGGDEEGQVPWVALSPVPPKTGPDGKLMYSAQDGAFAVNGGIFAAYWSHGVKPFVGSSYEADLRADINNRIQQAKAGNPVIPDGA